MRLAGCYFCNTLTRLDDYADAAVDPEGLRDTLLIGWIDRHKHGVADADIPGPKHGGAILWPFSEGDITIEDGKVLGGSWYTDHAGEKVEIANKIEKLKGDLQSATHTQWALRDEFKEEALGCFRRHRNPSWPGSPCRDYHADSKLIGRKNMPEAHRIYLCAMCPYEETVRVEKRWRAGQYRS